MSADPRLDDLMRRTNEMLERLRPLSILSKFDLPHPSELDGPPFDQAFYVLGKIQDKYGDFGLTLEELTEWMDEAYLVEQDEG